MTQRRGGLAIAVVALSMVPAGTANGSPAEAPALATTIGRLLRERLDAYGRRDAATWARYVDDACLCGGSTRAGLLAELAARPAALENGFGEIRDLEARAFGETVIAHYRVTEYSVAGGHRIELEQWRTETLLRRNGTYVLVAGASTLVPRDPAVARVDPRLYDEYAGRYEYAAGMVDTVSRDGDRIYVQTGGMEKEELRPESETTYFAGGQDWRLLFVRDADGRVAELRFRQNGQDLVARRLP